MDVLGNCSGATGLLRVDPVRFSPTARTVAQADVALVKRLVEQIQEVGCQGKHSERLACSQDNLPGSGEAEKEKQSRE